MKARRLMLPLGAGVVFVWLCIAVLTGFRRFEFALEGYAGLHLGDIRQEVLYRWGYPPEVLGPTVCGKDPPGCWQPDYYTSGKDPVNAMPSGKTANDFDTWGFDLPGNLSGNRALYVTFSNRNLVSEIACVDQTYTSNGCPSLLGVQVGDSEERLKRVLGPPTGYTYDGVTKTFQYDDLGVDFVLTKGTVYMINLFGARHRRAGEIFFHRYLRTVL